MFRGARTGTRSCRYCTRGAGSEDHRLRRRRGAARRKPLPERIGEEELAAPHLIDSEVTHVLRGLVRRGDLTDRQGDVALQGFTELTLTRFPADWLRPRMWALRHNLSAYDATYVALTELTDATALLTTDARLAKAPSPECTIELLS